VPLPLCRCHCCQSLDQLVAAVAVDAALDIVTWRPAVVQHHYLQCTKAVVVEVTCEVGDVVTFRPLHSIHPAVQTRYRQIAAHHRCCLHWMRWSLATSLLGRTPSAVTTYSIPEEEVQPVEQWTVHRGACKRLFCESAVPVNLFTENVYPGKWLSGQHPQTKRNNVVICDQFIRNEYTTEHINHKQWRQGINCHIYRLPKSFSCNQSVKSIIEVPRTLGNSAEPCWNQPHAETPFTKLCAIMSIRSLLSKVRGHQISVNLLRNAGESCNTHNNDNTAS